MGSAERAKRAWAGGESWAPAAQGSQRPAADPMRAQQCDEACKCGPSACWAHLRTWSPPQLLAKGEIAAAAGALLRHRPSLVRPVSIEVASSRCSTTEPALARADCTALARYCCLSSMAAAPEQHPGEFRATGCTQPRRSFASSRPGPLPPPCAASPAQDQCRNCMLSPRKPLTRPPPLPPLPPPPAEPSPATLPQPLAVLHTHADGDPASGPETTYYVLGTAHVSAESCEDVAKLIRAVRPQVRTGRRRRLGRSVGARSLPCRLLLQSALLHCASAALPDSPTLWLALLACRRWCWSSCVRSASPSSRQTRSVAPAAMARMVAAALLPHRAPACWRCAAQAASCPSVLPTNARPAPYRPYQRTRRCGSRACQRC